MFRHHLPTEASLEWSYIIIPVVLLGVWLFNAYKMGKFKKK